jgi:hypothetical protein
VSGEGIVELEMKAPAVSGTLVVTVTATTPFSRISRNIAFTVRASGGKMDFGRSTVFLQVGPDRQTGGSIELLSDRDMGSPFVLEARGLPQGLRIDLSDSVCDPLGVPIPLDFTMTAEPWLEPGRYFFFIKGSLFDGRTRAIGFECLVIEGSLSDFILSFQEERVSIEEGGRLEVHLLLQSIAGFSDEVELSLPDAISGLSLFLSEGSAVPTSIVTLTIEVESGPGPFFIRIVGSGGNLTREDILRLDTKERGDSLSLNLSNGPTRLSRTDRAYTARFLITLYPGKVPMSIEPIVLEGLPEGIEATISPNSLRTLPYPVEVTIEVRTEDDIKGPITFSMNVTPEGSTRSYRSEMVLLPYDDGPDEVGDGFPFAYIMVSIASVGIIIGLIIILFVSRRSSGYVEGKDRKKAPGSSPSHVLDAASFERHHGRRRGPDRMAPGKR